MMFEGKEYALYLVFISFLMLGYLSESALKEYYKSQIEIAKVQAGCKP